MAKPAIQRQSRTAVDLYNAYVEFLKIMLGNLFLMCAGSATALIAFMGNEKLTPDAATLVSIAGAKDAILSFGVGAVLAVLAAGLIALQENINSQRVENELGIGRAHLLSWVPGVVGVTVMLASGIVFAYGCWSAVMK